MKRYYLITLSWKANELVKIKDCKVFANTEDPLREIVNSNIATFNKFQRGAETWISEQILEIWRSECSNPFKCEDGLYRIVVTSDYHERSKSWKLYSNKDQKVVDVICDGIIEAERDIKIDSILNH